MKTLETVLGETSFPIVDSKVISYNQPSRIADCGHQTAENRMYKGSQQAGLHKLTKSRNKGDIYQPMVWVMALLVVAFVIGLING